MIFNFKRSSESIGDYATVEARCAIANHFS